MSTNETTAKPTPKQKAKVRVFAAIFAISLLVSLIFTVVGIRFLRREVGTYVPDTLTRFSRVTTPDEEGYDDTCTLCPVTYESDDGGFSVTVTYTYEEWAALGDDTGFGALCLREVDGDRFIAFTHAPTTDEIRSAVKDLYADEASPVFSAAIAFLTLAASGAVMLFFGKHFSDYETWWFLGIMVLATVFAVFFPEESCNGVSGILIMLLYLADTFFNILCELLISKQSKWNFAVSVLVEITEILICAVLAYRFATMATTLFFWLPIDIVSFINWHKKPDRENDEITRVRTLKGWQEALILVGIAAWTIGIGYLLSGIDLSTDLFGGNETLATVVCYLDACASAVGICNGLAILFRFREQWVCWFTEAILEGAINILSGQWVLLPLKLGYMTNCAYGYIEWTKYIGTHPEALEEKTIL